MDSKQRITEILNHRNADRIAVDFGATTVTGIHCKVVEGLRDYYGLEQRPVKIAEPYQMLGVIDDDLAGILQLDCIAVGGKYDMFGVEQCDWIEHRMPWGQVVMLPSGFAIDKVGSDCVAYPCGDRTASPSGIMPDGGYFFNAIERQNGEIDDSTIKVEDNLEEYGYISDESLKYWKSAIASASKTDRAVVANFGGMGLGDVALVPAMNLRNPKGIRNITDWYMSTIMREDYIKELFDRQTDIAISNLQKLNSEVGHMIDVVYICGTDFGTQDSQFCSSETFNDMYLPYYKKVNDWIHANTKWKTFKHSCGAILPLMNGFIDAGFDIINPVQINAKDMNPQILKDLYGDKITFWGGGVDTQKMLPFGAPEQIREQIKRNCEIMGHNGGFVFSSVHNVQANVPIKNVVTMMETINEIRG